MGESNNKHVRSYIYISYIVCEKVIHACYRKKKRESRARGWRAIGEGECGAVFNRTVKAGLIEKMTLEHSLEGGEKMDSEDIRRKGFPGQCHQLERLWVEHICGR